MGISLFQRKTGAVKVEEEVENELDDQNIGQRWRMFLAMQIITLVRIPLALAFAGVLLSMEHTSSVLAVCLGLVILIEFTDFIDGTLTRRNGLVTEWGALLDPYADSISRLIVYWALANAGLVSFFTPLAMALRDVTVAYSRILLIKHGQSGSARLGGKIKAEVQGIGAVLAVLGPMYWDWTGMWTIQAISWTVAVVTLASSIEYIRDAALAVKAARSSMLSPSSGIRKLGG